MCVCYIYLYEGLLFKEKMNLMMCFKNMCKIRESQMLSLQNCTPKEKGAQLG